MSSSFKLRATNPQCNPPSASVQASTTRQQRKFVGSNDKSGLRTVSRSSRNNKALLLSFLLLYMSSYCIDFVHCGQVSPSSINGLGKGISPSSSASSKDGGGKVADDSEALSTHHHPHHHHSYSSRHNRHRESTKSSHYSPPPISYPSTSGSIGYHHEYTPLSYYPDAYYEPRYFDRPTREFSARSTNYPAIAGAAASSQVGFTDTEYGGLALATGHGGGHHDGGHGHSHGHGHQTTYYKTVNKLDQSSLGLLGLLGLLSLLSNVLMLLTTTTTAAMMMMGAAGGAGGGAGGGALGGNPIPDAGGGMRYKRDTVMLLKMKDDENLPMRNVVERLSRLILPSLNVVGHAKDGRIPLNCTYQEICKTNKVLVQVFGADEGRPVASVMSTAIAKLLIDNKTREKNGARIVHEQHGTSSSSGGGGAPFLIVKKLLTEAGLAGRNGADCEVAYPTCEALNDSDFVPNGIDKVSPAGSFKLPFLVSPERAVAIIMGQNS